MDARTLALYEKCKENNPGLSKKDFLKAREKALNKASAILPHMVFLRGNLTPPLNGVERQEIFFANKEDDDED
jgi:hypothetical protein